MRILFFKKTFFVNQLMSPAWFVFDVFLICNWWYPRFSGKDLKFFSSIIILPEYYEFSWALAYPNIKIILSDSPIRVPDLSFRAPTYPSTRIILPDSLTWARARATFSTTCISEHSNYSTGLPCPSTHISEHQIYSLGLSYSC